MKKNNPLLKKYMSQKYNKELSKLKPNEIEFEFVEKSYNGFGYDFHNKVIPEIQQYMQKQIESHDLVLDIGCGNGEYLKYIK